jgi:antitoxin component of MazEF toxin-antitoxin module
LPHYGYLTAECAVRLPLTASVGGHKLFWASFSFTTFPEWPFIEKNACDGCKVVPEFGKMLWEVAMPQLTIVSHGDSAAVILPTAVLDALGVRIGDVLEAAALEQQLILRPVSAARQQQIEEITRAVFEQRRDAYQRLA